MSTLAYRDGAGELTASDQLTKKIRDDIRIAREDRKRFEPTWHSNLAFAAGKFWLTWDRYQRRLVEDPRLRDRELYTADVITEYRTTALGELGSDDDRPEILLRRDDQFSEDFQRQLNRAVSWGWDYEWRGDEALAEVDGLIVDLGTAAIRCRYDPTVGPIIGEVPHVGGRPVHDPREQAVLADQFSQGVIQDVQMREVQRGRIAWDVGSPFNLLVPPGIPRERNFPWECWVAPALLSAVRKEFGDVALDLKEDTDIGSSLGYDLRSDTPTEQNVSSREGKAGRVKDHVWLFTYYERPCPDYPEGRTIVFASNKMKTMRMTDGLPMRKADGTPSSGITYFHWWRVTGRFWSRALIEPMKDPQRLVNKRRTQSDQIIDRGLPFVIVQRNSPAKERKGLAVELLEIGEQERAPQVVEGVKPGPWMREDIEAAREDLVHATGIRGPRLGENPINVTTYAQLALLGENDQLKRQTIVRDRKRSVGELVEYCVHGIHTYWGPDRQIMLADEENEVDSFVFNSTRIPDFYLVRVAKGASKPRSQAAELKKIEDLWNAALTSTAVALNPTGWVQWYKESLEQGQALDLPESGMDEHEDKAELENHMMLVGESFPVQYYDPIGVHVPIHRQLQIDAELKKDLDLWKRIELHIQEHFRMEIEKAQTLGPMAPPELPMLPGAPGPSEPAPEA